MLYISANQKQHISIVYAAMFSRNEHCFRRSSSLPLFSPVIVITTVFACRRHYHCFRLSSSLQFILSIVVITIVFVHDRPIQW
jgi:hypothetical protein